MRYGTSNGCVKSEAEEYLGDIIRPTIKIHYNAADTRTDYGYPQGSVFSRALWEGDQRRRIAIDILFYYSKLFSDDYQLGLKILMNLHQKAESRESWRRFRDAYLLNVSEEFRAYSVAGLVKDNYWIKTIGEQDMINMEAE